MKIRTRLKNVLLVVMNIHIAAFVLLRIKNVKIVMRLGILPHQNIVKRGLTRLMKFPQIILRSSLGYLQTMALVIQEDL